MAGVCETGCSTLGRGAVQGGRVSRLNAPGSVLVMPFKRVCVRCGHARDIHVHLRAGSDCSRCDCAGWQTLGLGGRWGRLMRRTKVIWRSRGQMREKK